MGKGFQGFCYNCGGFGHSAAQCPTKGKGKGGKGAYSSEWEPWQGDGGGYEQQEEGEEQQEEEVQHVSDAVSWGGGVIGSLGSCRAVREDRIQTKGNWENVEMIVDSGCRRTIFKPEMVKKHALEVRTTPNTGRSFQAANGTTIPNQGEATLNGCDKTGNSLNIVGQVAATTKNLGSVMEMVDAKLKGGKKNWVMFHEAGGYIQTMTKEEEAEVKALLNKMRGARVPIERRGNDFIVDIKVKKQDAKQEDGFMKAKKTFKKQHGDPMEVDAVRIEKGRYGLLTNIEEKEYERCQPCGGAAWCFHRRW